jgi:phosphoglycerol transferase
VFVMAIQYFPVWNYHRIHGSNLSIVHRTVAEVEFYSLKLSNLLLPVVNHRLSFLNHLQQKSNPVYLIGEGSDSLGILGSIGFVGLITVLVFRLVRHRLGLTTALSAFTFLSALTCIVGGLAQFIAVFGFTQLRVMSRMSIVIAFPSIIFAVLLICKMMKRWNHAVALSVMTLVMVISVLDTNPVHLLPSFETTASHWHQDKKIVERLELIAKRNSMVLQLPHIEFPEGAPQGELGGYDHLRGYLHSSTLRWSFGSIKSSRQDINLVTEPFDISDTKKLQTLGFSFIWLNASGYGDSGEIVKCQVIAAGNQLEFSLYGIDVFRIGTNPSQTESNGC